MAILKFSKFKKERSAVREAKTKQSLNKKHIELFNEKLKEFGVSTPTELSEVDQIKFFDSLKPVLEAKEQAGESGLAKEDQKGDKIKLKYLDDDADGKIDKSDGKGSGVPAKKEEVNASGKVVEAKEQAGESGLAKEDQKGDNIEKKYLDDDADGKMDKSDGKGSGTPAKKEEVNASGKVVEQTTEEKLEEALAKIAILEAKKPVDEAVILEADVKDAAGFKAYAEALLKKAHGDDYDAAKAKETIDGIAKEHGDDWGAAIGVIHGSLA